ncbi:excinuclease ABC subunit C [Natranaerovirga hydrolytica]|uniref:UvrABC system protein C n=1 Tax=Natranaerovirga hydrolytica TaxID=680378 RepID=A0A4V2Q0E5_9FIRM|nr:excinuclease ABC subunit UvrC [Natranaerovirga hydrolytica]TCK93481.1 excinuclease ABC subunit C [Natranaerovirga hydrolytica]
MFDIQEELKKLPDKPGVYIMKNKNDEIIYIGKAINLKNRVRQYFQSSRNMMTKIQKMVSHISYFEYTVTDSELEALILESNLIKQHKPKYNTRLKDDKHYPYIKVTVNEAYPRVVFTRQMKKDKSKYFGPYTNGTAVKETIDLIQKIWKIRTCNRNLPRDIGKQRPCLNYHIGQCSAPCQGYVSEGSYNKMIDEIMSFLGGKFDKVTKDLEEKMQEAAHNLEFEKAAELRDQINSVKSISEKQKAINASMEDQDIIAFARAFDEALVQVFFIRSGKLIGKEHFRLDKVEELSREAVMTTFIKQFYSGTPFIPKEIVVQEDIEENELIAQWLSEKRGQKVYIKKPVKGEKSKLVELAAKNAMLTLEQFGERIRREEKRTQGAVKEIEKYLGVDFEIKRIEAYDISNIGGFQSVGSMIVYEEGKPKRSDYRKFKIKWVKGPNDYASMEEVLTRRLTHAIREAKELEEKGLEKEYGKFTKLPDIIFMDGGKGQVGIAQKVLNHLNMNIPVCGMVKDDMHRTRGLYYNNEEIVIDKHSEAFKLLTRIQDEVHRFAIEYHRKIRSKNQVQSILDEISGIGEVRRKSLIKHFKSVEKIKKATVEELESVDNMNKKSAEAVYHFFH